jgi:hypothetical protein
MTAIVATEDFYTLDEHDILADPQTGLPVFSWSGQATIRNKIDILYDFNDPALRKDDFGRRQVWTADASVTRYGPQPASRMEFAGIRTNRGGQALMDTLALGFLQRWGQAPWFLRIAVTFRRHPLEILDSVRISHPLITNPITGRLGLVREAFEILEVVPQWGTEGKLQLLLLWTGAIETSAVPTSTGGLSLVPGLGTTDETDMPIPLAGSVLVTTAAGTRALTIGLKAMAYRKWRCTFNRQVFFQDPTDKGDPGACIASGQSDVRRSYTSEVTYRIEYKVAAAPDAPGTGVDPTTGWVELKATTSRGAVAMFNQQTCSADEPVTPAEDFWIEHFPVLGASPATYDVKVFYESIAAQAEPCSGINPAICSTGGCGGSLAATTLTADEDDVSLDYLISIA